MKDAFGMMRFVLLGIAMLALDGHAADIPYNEEMAARLAALEGSQLPVKAKGSTRFVWDCSGNSGSCSVGSNTTSGRLPANALITDTYFFVQTAPTMVGETAQNNKAGSGTIAFGCSTAGNLLPATWAVSTMAANQIYPGAIGGFSTVGNTTQNTSSSNGINRWVGTGSQILNQSPCTVNAVVGTSAFSAGKIVGFVDFVIIQ